MERIRVLFLAASPSSSPLRLDEEIREITAKIRAADYQESLEVISRWAVRPDDLQQTLLEHRPHVLHFSGHGTESEELVLLDSQGKPKPVSKQALANLLRVLKDNLRLVILNACFSRPQAEAITEVIDCAIGMNRAVGDDAAVKFAAAFYRAIGFGRSIQTAFDLGKSALMLDGIPEETTPQLLARAGVDPAGIVLIPPDEGERDVPIEKSKSRGPAVDAPPEVPVDAEPAAKQHGHDTQDLSTTRSVPSDQHRRPRFATRWLGVMSGLLLAFAMGFGWWWWNSNGLAEARRLVEELSTKDDATEHRSFVDNELSSHNRRWIIPELHRKLQMEPSSEIVLQMHRADEAIALVRLDAFDEARSAFQRQESGDPGVSTKFIARAKKRGVTSEQLVRLYERATTERDDATRFAATLTLGTLDEEERTTAGRRELAARLKQVYANDPSSAIHSATGWLLGVWKLPPPDVESRSQATERHSWYVNSAGLTMVRIPEGKYRIGSEEENDNKPGEVEVSEFWLSACEVTVAQFHALLPEMQTPQTDDARTPMSEVTWYDAVLFCNRLSDKDKLSRCYELAMEEEDENKHITKARVAIVTGKGYRLPKEAEWEIACRAKTNTTYSFGNDNGDLGDYGWFRDNANEQSHAVAEKRPNLWGLHDMHGNMWEWCQDSLDKNYSASSPGVDPPGSFPGVLRVYRGGGWFDSAEDCRSSYRYGRGPSSRSGSIGFRVARSPSVQ